MTATAIFKFAKVSSQKCRLVADTIRNKKVDEAEKILQFTTKKSSKLIQKVLLSAKANAITNHGLAEETLFVKKIMVEKGPAVKRIRPRAKGRAYRIIKHYCHIFITVSNR